MTACLLGILLLKQESNQNKTPKEEKGVGIDENEKSIGTRSPPIEDLLRDSGIKTQSNNSF